MQKLALLFVTLILTFFISCNTQPESKAYILKDSEKAICDTLQIDTTIVQYIREYSSNKIEPFHYSLSKIIQNDTVIEADPIYLKGLVFSEKNSKSYDIVLSLKGRFKNKGYSIFLLENNFNIDNHPDNIGILKTTDKYTVLKQIGTDGINYNITNDSLISIIKIFDTKYSLDLIGASGDWCEFIILKEPESWMQFANEVYKACPDVVDQGAGTVQALADEMKKNKAALFLVGLNLWVLQQGPACAGLCY